MSDSQKFIARNRAPRVQIEYDVELYGAEKKIQLPFVMGVMSDLSGKSEVAQPSIKDRKFLEIDSDNFDSRMKSMKPRAAFSVANTLTGEGSLSVDLTFEKMSDFSPAAIASKVEPLRKLLEARTQLNTLLTYMDGKAGAEEMIERLMEDPEKFRALALGGAEKPEATQAAFDAIKASAPQDIEAEDPSGDILAKMAKNQPEAEKPDDSINILADMALGAPADDAQDDSADAALDAMRNIAPDDEVEEDNATDLLAEMAAQAPEEIAEIDTSVDILAEVSAQKGDAPASDDTALALAAMRAVDVVEEGEDSNDELLAELASAAPEDHPPEDDSDDILSGLAKEQPEDTPVDNSAEQALEAMRAADVIDEVEESSDSLLAELAADAPEDVEDNSAEIALDALRDIEIEDEVEERNDDLLSEMASGVVDEVAEDKNAGILADLAEAMPDEQPLEDQARAALEAMRAVKIEETPEPDNDDLLAEISFEAPEEITEEDGSAAALAALREVEIEPVAEENNDDLLADIALAAPEDEEEEDILADLEFDTPEDPLDEGSDDILAELSLEIENEEQAEDSLDILSGLGESVVEDAPEADILADLSFEDPVDDSDDILAELVAEPEDDDLDDILLDISAAPIDEVPEEDILAGLEFDEAEDEAAEDSDDILAGIDLELDDIEPAAEDDSILASLEPTDEEPAALEDEQEIGSPAVLEAAIAQDEEQDMESLLADIGIELDDLEETETDADDLEAMLAESGVDFSAEVEELSDASEIEERGVEEEILVEEIQEETADNALDDLLAQSVDDFDDLLTGDDDLSDLLADNDDDDDLSGLLADDDELDDLLSDDSDDDLAALLGDDDDEDLAALLGNDDDFLDDSEDKAEETPVSKPKKPAFQPSFGSMSASKMQDEAGSRRKFRIAILGDFSGRGNKGNLETGADFAKRKGFKLDFDTMDDVIARFRTTLTLPLGNDGTAVEVELNELDDLHPDELFENVEMFNELNMLRRDLVSGRNLDAAIVKMQGWGAEFGDFRTKSTKRAKGSAAPADLRLSDFQNLIGDSTPTADASAAGDLISRIVGPHIVAAKDTGSQAMIAAVDAALSSAMSSVLHHPDFQTVEAGWRALELLGRRIEASASLEVVVYDMSVEEFAADLAGSEDMADTGLYDMLVEKPRLDESGGPFAAVFGLYTWEETPPHAEILARMARICANMDAPFVSAMSTGFMGVKPEDRHKLVQDTWAALREMPEAKYLGLATPRFLLRMPYGKKTEPVDRFGYEEFTVKDGMGSLLMANPATLVAVLLGETLARQGKDMSLGSIMSLDDMPFHYMTDQYGDQVALPCTERLLNVRTSAEVIARGYMPVISVQGQNMVKLGSFQAVGGGELLGIWSGDGAKHLSSGAVRMQTSVGFAAGAVKEKPPAAAKPAGEDDLGAADDLDLDLDLGGNDLDLEMGGDDDLDDLLAGFGDSDDLDLGDDDDMDDDLAALLGDL